MRLNFEPYFTHFPTPLPPPGNYCTVPKSSNTVKLDCKALLFLHHLCYYNCWIRSLSFQFSVFRVVFRVVLIFVDVVAIVPVCSRGRESSVCYDSSKTKINQVQVVVTALICRKKGGSSW